jgi:hypothetical protein
MRFQWIAVHGSSAACVSAGALAGLFVAEQVENTFGYGIAIGMAAFVAYFLALFLWLGAFNVILFDLERRERPVSGTRVLLIPRVLAMLAIGISVLVLLALLTPRDSNVSWLYGLMFLAVGAVILVHNIEARRARVLHGALPWLGIVVGVAYLVVALGYVAWHFAPEVGVPVLIGLHLGIIEVGSTPMVIDVNARYLAQLLYIVWAIWLGVALRRTTALAPAPAL